jgi:Icc-related predicted phosphoesterase
MKINLISDCHINFEDLVLPGGDVLIAAGDIIEAGHLRQADNDKHNTHIADRYRRFFSEEFVKYQHVIYVAGNHEHYRNSYPDTHDRIRRELPPNVHFLEAESVQIEDVHFFGGTFWSDMNKGDPITASVLKQSMADFSGAIKFGDGIRIDTMYGDSYYTSKFTPGYAKGVFHETVEKLKKFLEAHANDKVVVVSHHAPSSQSIAPHYKHDFHMNGGYHSHLDEFIMDHPQIKTWVHGHMHDAVDYMIGSTRILSNPRGYKGYEEQAETFNPDFYFEV